MQTTSVLFKTLADSDVRPIRADVFISFTKAIEPTLPGIQDWDKYVYTDYTTRLISVEWSRTQDEYASLGLATADIVLDNSDGYFTPNSSSPLSNYNKPDRPIKIYSGFGSETIQVFVGLTEGLPTVNDREKTVTFHARDFLAFLLKKSMDESSLFVNKRTDEILRSLLNDQGIADAQMSLDAGVNLIPFAYAESGKTLESIIWELMEAEGGRFFLSETGVITFKNRRNYSTEPVKRLTPYTNIVDSIPLNKDEMINVVEIKGSIRSVQPSQPYGQLTEPVKIPAGIGQTAEVWIDFPDPITSVQTPVFILSALTSYWNANTEADGSGLQYEGATVQSVEVFATSAKITFSSIATIPLWITEIVLFATPAVVTQTLYIREQDDTSVSENGERILQVENEYFGDEDNARSKALIILNTFADVGDVRQLQIKADPSLQLDDPVLVDLFGVLSTQRILKITNKISAPGKYVQLVQVGKLLDNSNYFTIGISSIGGDDMIAP